MLNKKDKQNLIGVKVSEVSNNLKELYKNYYSDEIKVKRHLAAVDSVREIKRITKGKKFNHILDIGVGEGAVLQELENCGFSKKISAVEISQSGIDAVKERDLKTLVEIKQFDGYQLPYSDKEFDLAIATHVLEHVEHERSFLKEISRVADRVIISVPLEHTRKINYARVAGVSIGHINFYTIDTFRSILETSGLIIEDSYTCVTSKEYELFCSPKFGHMKYFIRKLALAISPRLAGFLFMYMAIAICRVDDKKRKQQLSDGIER